MGDGKSLSGGTALSSLPSQIDSALTNIMFGSDAISSTIPIVKGVMERIEEAIESGSPWERCLSPDPDPEIAEVRDLMRDFLNGRSVLADDGNNSGTPWETFYTEAKARADVLFPDQDNAELITAWDAQTEPEFAAAVNAVTGGLYMANAAESSCLPVAMAILYRGHEAERERFRLSMRLNLSSTAGQFVNAAIAQMSAMQIAKVQTDQNALVARIQTMAAIISAQRDEQEANLDYAYKDALWELNVLASFGYSGVASIGGAPMIPMGPSKLSSALGSAFSMASAGVQVGSAGGVQGGIAGGVIGGALGLAMGLLE